MSFAKLDLHGANVFPYPFVKTVDLQGKRAYKGKSLVDEGSGLELVEGVKYKCQHNYHCRNQKVTVDDIVGVEGIEESVVDLIIHKSCSKQGHYSYQNRVEVPGFFAE